MIIFKMALHKNNSYNSGSDGEAAQMMHTRSHGPPTPVDETTQNLNLGGTWGNTWHRDRRTTSQMVGLKISRGERRVTLRIWYLMPLRAHQRSVQLTVNTGDMWKS